MVKRPKGFLEVGDENDDELLEITDGSRTRISGIESLGPRPAIGSSNR